MTSETSNGIVCPFCGEYAKWCENREIYGRNYGKSYMCYYCKPCNAYVGCHKNSRRPLGTMANKKTREWRKKAHAIVDPLWKDNKNRSRGRVYERLSEYFKKEIHVAESDVDMCKKIIEAVPIVFSLSQSNDNNRT